MPKPTIHVIGISENLNELSHFPEDFWQDVEAIIASSRYLALLPEHLQALGYPITPLQEALDYAAKAKEKCVFLASGDPLFYGIASTLLEKIAHEHLCFYPSLSCIQKACALAKTPWHDAEIISLHGRTHPHIAGQLLQHKKSIVLTDATNTPADIARKVHEYLKNIDALHLEDNIEICVAENLSSEDERFSRFSLQEAMARDFSSLNVLIFLNHNKRTPWGVLGLSEEDFAHSRGLITKNEVRAASLHALNLPTTGVLWDLGAGSGSVSIEAARMAPKLTIYAIEQRPEEIANIKANIVRFSCYNIIPLHGRAEDFIATLPKPDRIFVGGSGGALENFTRIASKVLPVGGRLVVNSVLPKTAHDAPQFMKAHGMTVYSSTIATNRQKAGSDPQTFNPITIIVGSL